MAAARDDCDGALTTTVALILDEPTTGLDVTIQSDIMELDRRPSRQRDSHRLIPRSRRGGETCDEIVVMNAGRVVETGSTEKIFTAPAQAYTRRLMAASQLVEVAA